MKCGIHNPTVSGGLLIRGMGLCFGIFHSFQTYYESGCQGVGCDIAGHDDCRQCVFDSEAYATVSRRRGAAKREELGLHDSQPARLFCEPVNQGSKEILSRLCTPVPACVPAVVYCLLAVMDTYPWKKKRMQLPPQRYGVLRIHLRPTEVCCWVRNFACGIS